MRKALLAGVVAAASPAQASTECALVIEGEAVKFRTFVQGCPESGSYGVDPVVNYDWRPVSRPARPPIDPATHVAEGPTPTVSASEVILEWGVRPKTAQEIAQEKDAIAAGINRAVFEALCHLKNEVRTKVDGVAAWSKMQCMNAFRSLLDQ